MSQVYPLRVLREFLGVLRDTLRFLRPYYKMMVMYTSTYISYVVLKDTIGS